MTQRQPAVGQNALSSNHPTRGFGILVAPHNQKKNKGDFFTLPLLCEFDIERKSNHLPLTDRIHRKDYGVSGMLSTWRKCAAARGNQNAFRHGLAGIAHGALTAL